MIVKVRVCGFVDVATIFWNPFMDLDSIASCFMSAIVEHVCVDLISQCWCWRSQILYLVLLVLYLPSSLGFCRCCWLYLWCIQFVGDGHIISQAHSGLRWQTIVCARAEDASSGCCARCLLDSSGSVWKFMVTMALILWVFFAFIFLF